MPSQSASLTVPPLVEPFCAVISLPPPLGEVALLCNDGEGNSLLYRFSLFDYSLNAHFVVNKHEVGTLAGSNFASVRKSNRH